MKRLSKILLISFLMTLFFSIPVLGTSRSIRNNGVYGLYIDINKAPYNENWTITPSGPTSCTWFAQARVKELTGIATGNIVYGCDQWYYEYGPSKGLATGKILRRDCKSLICWSSPHIAVVEGFTPDGKIIISEGGILSYYDGSQTVYLNQENDGHCLISQINSQRELENKNSGFRGYVYLPVQAMGYDGKLSVNTSIRGNQVDVYWTMTQNAVSHSLHIEKIGTSYTYDADFGLSYFTHMVFGEGDYRVTLTGHYSDGTSKSAQTLFSVGKLNPKITTRGTTVNASWNDIGADSYWVQVVSKASGTSVYSAGMGTGTSASFKFSEGDFIMHVTATVDGKNIKTESVEFTTDTDLHVQVKMRGCNADVSWIDIGADSYWAQVISKKTGASVYSAGMGKQTAVSLLFSEGDYTIHITPTTNGVNGKTCSADFTCDRNIYVTTDVFGGNVDLTWNDIGADSYWAQVINNQTGQSVYSAGLGKATAVHFLLSTGNYTFYITPTTNGVNGKAGSAKFTTFKAEISMPKGDGGVYLPDEITKISTNMEEFDSASLTVYHTPQDGTKYEYLNCPVDGTDYIVSFPYTGEYSCTYTFQKGDYTLTSNTVNWTVIENTYDTMILPADTRIIEKEAFADLPQGLNVVVGDSVESIADDAFADSEVLLIVPYGSYAENYCMQKEIPYKYQEE